MTYAVNVTIKLGWQARALVAIARPLAFALGADRVIRLVYAANERWPASATWRPAP